MTRAYASAVVPAGAQDVWSRVREFNGLPDWHPAITGSELEGAPPAVEVGAVRHLTLGDGGAVVERLVALDDGDRSMTYDILKSAFSVRRYRATIRVRPVTATADTFVEWYADFDSEGADETELVEFFSGGVFGTGLRGLRDLFAG
ncbi:SRPBCC family protein [Allosaccharopolyspora coralli]|uniref:SRPBCC family protein n=1 Tax=Allosaccharopolyspora coralli TaxID=2665642 RepID=A0A5Q3Q8U0_9PSEU|nr:SRPBCC family protein [Allosaccharopolyspora coralli]QGK70793.1 SRPBCC family protein [Allosaccharopolyspora coralli]